MLASICWLLGVDTQVITPGFIVKSIVVDPKLVPKLLYRPSEIVSVRA